MKELKRILLGVGISVIMTIILLIIFSLILVKSDVKEQFINSGVIIVSGISIFVGTFISNIKVKKSGIINGILESIIYVAILYITSSMLNGDYTITMSSIFMIIVALILGASGGVVGVNIK